MNYSWQTETLFRIATILVERACRHFVVRTTLVKVRERAQKARDFSLFVT